MTSDRTTSLSTLHSSLIPKGYKQTEVGVIPEDWEVVEIGAMATILTGNTPPTLDRSNYGNDFMFVSPSDMGTSKYLRKTEKMLSKKGFSIS
jgi:type I restriction enzyme S subunit